jgi:hypothetical protein
MNMRTLRMAVVLVGIMSVPVNLQSAEQNNFVNRAFDATVRFGGGFSAYSFVNAMATGIIANAAGFQLQNLSRAQLAPFHLAVLIGSITSGLTDCFLGSGRPMPMEYIKFGIYRNLIAVPLTLHFMRCFLPLIR